MVAILKCLKGFPGFLTFEYGSYVHSITVPVAASQESQIITREPSKTKLHYL